MLVCVLHHPDHLLAVGSNPGTWLGKYMEILGEGNITFLSCVGEFSII